MLNKGLSQHRFKDNQLEKNFAEEWEYMNTNRQDGKLDGRGTLDYMLSGTINKPMGEVTKRDRIVAATVIQWLGSHIGEAFIKRVSSR